MLKREDQFTERQYVHATTADTFTAAATSTTTFIATTYKTECIKMKITKVYKYTSYKKDISAMS